MSTEACTCVNRKLTREQAVIFAIPQKDGSVLGLIFAKDCPLHGCRDITAEKQAEKPAAKS